MVTPWPSTGGGTAPTHRSGATCAVSPTARPAFWAAAVAGAILSLIVTGYVFPAENNVFHLPIVARLWERPEFADDAFIQSLRHFSSGVWMLLTGSAEWIEPRTGFLALLFVSRLLSFVGFLACADHFGLREAKQMFLFTALVAVTPLMQGLSFAGRGGLFIDTFTHSEVANGLFLLALWAALRSRFALALTLIGVTFFVNAFFGVWLGFVLAFVVGREVIVGRLAGRRSAVTIAAGLTGATAFALPVVLAFVANPDFGRPIDFDFVDFLDYSYPNHVLFRALPWHQGVGLAMVVAIAVLALRRLGDPDGRTTVALAACVLLYAIGMVAPAVTHAPLVLNLHLLRSGTLIHLLATLLVVTLTVRWWFGEDRLRMAMAAGMIVTMAVHPGGPMRHVLVAVLLAILVADLRLEAWTGRAPREAWLAPRVRHLRAGVFVAVGLSTAVSVAVTWSRVVRADAWSAEWGAVADWAGRATRPGTLFLTPFGETTDTGPPNEEEKLGVRSNTAFEYRSHRSLWVDPKRGAMVLWSPSTHAVWRRRMEETKGLKTHAERVGYSKAHGIAYVVEISSAGCGDDTTFQTKRLCVSEVR